MMLENLILWLITIDFTKFATKFANWYKTFTTMGNINHKYFLGEVRLYNGKN